MSKVKPRNVKEGDLFRLEIWLKNPSRYILIGDCSYNEKDKVFTQIYDLSTWELKEIYAWSLQPSYNPVK